MQDKIAKLEDEVEGLRAKTMVISQQLGELLGANIDLRTGTVIQQNRLVEAEAVRDALVSQVQELRKQIEGLTPAELDHGLMVETV